MKNQSPRHKDYPFEELELESDVNDKAHLEENE